ncbi:MAG: hypothetical protein HOE90_12020 [Bacteriovoracaceae bacterium]|jgi:hypothetical protein|nr:hypothetical protein [Bacteriovoracaceae bacterium]
MDRTIDLKSLLLVALFSVFLAFASEAFAGSGKKKSGFVPCRTLKVFSPDNALDMASLMGKYKIFNVTLLSKYEDESRLGPGEVVVIAGKDRWPEAMSPFKVLGGVYFYEFQRRKEVLALSFGKAKKRNLASSGHVVTKCALKSLEK